MKQNLIENTIRYSLLWDISAERTSLRLGDSEKQALLRDQMIKKKSSKI